MYKESTGLNVVYGSSSIKLPLESNTNLRYIVVVERILVLTLERDAEAISVSTSSNGTLRCGVASSLRDSGDDEAGVHSLANRERGGLGRDEGLGLANGAGTNANTRRNSLHFALRRTSMESNIKCSVCFRNALRLRLRLVKAAKACGRDALLLTRMLTPMSSDHVASLKSEVDTNINRFSSS